MTTLGDKIREAIETQDATLAGRIADQLRFKHGLNFQQSFEVIKKASPDTELADWAALLYEADTLDSRRPAHQRIAFRR